MIRLIELSIAQLHTYGKIVGANSGSAALWIQSIMQFLEIHTPRFHHKERSHLTNSPFQWNCLSVLTVLTVDATPMDCLGITRLPRATWSIHSFPEELSIYLRSRHSWRAYLRTNQSHRRQTREIKSLLRVSLRSGGCLPRYCSSFD